jgi:hypothetical protein
VDREERIARNEVLFREVNERVREVRPEEPEAETGFLCECGEELCTETVYLSVAEYENVRSDPTQFIVRPGHEIGDVEAVIHRDERFTVVRKHPSEAAKAIRTDPRS